MTIADHTTTPHGVDLSTLTDDQLRTLGNDVDSMLRARWRMATAPAQTEQIARQYHADLEATLPPLAEGEHRPWTQPTGGHDAYPRGAVVAHNERVWESKHPANVWEPGAPGVDDRLWADVTENAPNPEPMPDAPPFKAGEQVKPGDLRTYNGTVYRCLQEHTTADHWTPDAAASLWTRA